MNNQEGKNNFRPEPFEFYTAEDLWNDKYISKQMLSYHLNESVDLSSRNAKFIDRSARWIVSHFNIGPGTAIADFGCGPGLYTTRFAKEGADVTGIDFSERSIRYAKETATTDGLKINYVAANYLEFDTEKKFDLITMIMCDFCALSPEQRKKLLNKFHKMLKPGGSILLDVCSLAAFEQQEESSTYERNLLDGFWSADDYMGYLDTFKYENEKVTLSRYKIVEKERTRTIYNWMQYFGQEAITGEFSENGFEIEAWFSSVAGEPFDTESPEFAIVAKKP
jgi:cyclopropane fatty-acyl-phospholipid synthase-like methyltransferase